MRGKPAFLFASILLSFNCFLFLNNFSVHLPLTEEAEMEQGEKEDGIKIIQQHEFDITKDPALGFVPNYRLIQANVRLLMQRKARENSTSQTQGFNWIERGPYADIVGADNVNTRSGAPAPATSGRIRTVWVDLADGTNKTVWVGGADGGIWKTTDITASPSPWAPVNDFMANLAISSISQDPTNTNIMYCGTGEKTFNVDAVDGGGVWKSLDHGLTWNLLSSTIGFWNVSKVICDNSGNVYVGTIGSGSGLQRSTDGGNTWTTITPTINAGGGGNINTTRVADMVYDAVNGKLHVVMGYSPGTTPTVYQGYCYTTSPSTVSSTSWTAATNPFPVSPNSIDNCALACSGNTVYALPANASGLVSTIYKSTNGGVTWAATGSTPTNAGNVAFTNGQAWYCLAIGINPSNTNNVIVGSLNCYKTNDGGSTWTQLSYWVGTSGNYIHADQHSLVWNGSQVLVSSDGGLFYSSNSGTTFNDRNINLRLKQFYSCAVHPTSTNYFLAGAQDNGVHQFNGPGLTTTVEVIGGDGGFVAIDQNETSYQFGSYVYNHYHRSSDGGNTWVDFDFYKGNAPATRKDFGSFINPFDYDNTTNALYAGADAGEFFRWTNPQTLGTGTYHDGGSGFPPGADLISITNIGTGVVSAVKVSPYSNNRVFFGTSAGKIVKVDNANTVSSGSAGTNIGSASFPQGNISCVNVGTTDNNLIASFSNYGVMNVWVSTNGGTNWSAIDGDLPDIPVRWVMFYPGDNTKAIIATEAGVFQTGLINGGSTLWSQEATLPVVRTDMLTYRSSDNTIVAATHGRGLWSTTVPTLLPVKLINFEGHLLNNLITLDWQTGSEYNSKNFVVEKSIDGKNFYSIGSINAVGNMTSHRDYSIIDNKVSDINYYRLKMVNLDGSFVYSNVILIKKATAQQFVWVITNPFRDYIDIRFARMAKISKLQLITMDGKVIIEKILQNVSGQQRWQLSNHLKNGAYILRAISDGVVFTNKLVKQ
jgi:photosystem II stability/assembly factor-like uncharacterized protein